MERSKTWKLWSWDPELSRIKLASQIMKILFLLITLNLPWELVGQKTNVDKTPVNSLNLGSPISDFKGQVNLLTGNEEIYQKNEWLRESLLKNIRNGIREGYYTGEHSYVNGLLASRTTLIFYNDELYKIRWSFDVYDFPRLQETGPRLNDFLASKYGPGKEDEIFILNIWQARKNYLQSFLDDTEYQIEYRNRRIHKKVEALK